MFEITVKMHFDAAHFLRAYQGKCENLHGHRYEVAVTVGSNQLNETGLAFDFSSLKRILSGVLRKYDHTCLNDLDDFRDVNPSAENIAMKIYSYLSNELSEINIISVTVWESPDSWVTYKP